MVPKRHRKITKSALASVFNEKSALELIIYANQQSDEIKYWSAGWKRQHFSLNPNQGQVASIRNAKSFYDNIARNINNLAHLMRTKGIRNPLFFDAILYSLGRACHCIQDFYAHSNWVWLSYVENEEEYNINKQYDIWDQDIRNPKLKISLYAGHIKEGLAKGVVRRKYNEQDTLRLFILKPIKPVKHWRMNLDDHGTVADRLYHKYTGAWGYKVAQNLAKEHTTKYWRWAIAPSLHRNKIYNELIKHKPNMSEKSKRKLQNYFDQNFKIANCSFWDFVRDFKG